MEHAASDPLVRAFAAAVRGRDHPVEQEACVPAVRPVGLRAAAVIAESRWVRGVEARFRGLPTRCQPAHFRAWLTSEETRLSWRTAFPSTARTGACIALPSPS
jgi:hypothetical protein